MIINLKCQCGKLKGQAFGPFRKKHSRAVCMCDDCQAYAHHLGQASEILDSNGGTEIIALYPDQIKLTDGVENLKCLRLSSEGMFRWYAGCCHSAIANSAAPKLPFAGVVHTFIDLDEKEKDSIFGPVFVRFLAKYGNPPFPPNTYMKTPWILIITTLPFILKGFIKKKYLPSPFFQEDGTPKVEPQVLEPKV